MTDPTAVTDPVAEREIQPIPVTVVPVHKQKQLKYKSGHLVRKQEEDDEGCPIPGPSQEQDGRGRWYK